MSSVGIGSVAMSVGDSSSGSISSSSTNSCSISDSIVSTSIECGVVPEVIVSSSSNRNGRS